MNVPSDHQVQISTVKAATRGLCVAKSCSWGSLVDRLVEEPARSEETMAEFHALPKGERNELKLADGFVGGATENGRRRGASFLYRWLLTLDIDVATREFLDDLKDGAGPLGKMAYAGHTTRSSTPENPRVRLVLPLKTPIPAAAYPGVIRGLCRLIEGHYEGVEVDEKASVDVARLLYGPTLCVDAPHVPLSNTGSFPDCERLSSLAGGHNKLASTGAATTKKKRSLGLDGSSLDSHWKQIMEAAGAVFVESRNRQGELATNCPFHTDEDPSLDITTDGKMVCRAGCEAGDGRPITWARYVAKVRGCDVAGAFDFARSVIGVPEGHSREASGVPITGDRLPRIEGATAGLCGAPDSGTDVAVESLVALAGKTKESPDLFAELVSRCRELQSIRPLEYEQGRIEIAGAASIRVTALDAHVIVKGAKAEHEDNISDPFPQVATHEEAVDGDELLADLVSYYGRFLILPDDGALLLALWTLFGFAIEAFDIAPRLLVVGPTRTCGKSRVLTVLASVCVHVARAANLSGAALGRTIELYKPFVFLDEVDTYVDKNHPDLLGILNSGHDRDGAFMLRCVGDDHAPTKFSTWAPMVLAGIGGRMPDTTRSRCIALQMRRKLKTESVERITRVTKREGAALGARAKRWATDNEELIRAADEACIETNPDGSWLADVPDERDSDNWRSLVSVAQVIGGAWWQTAKDAALRATVESGELDEEPSVLLLGDLRTIFEDEDKMRTALIIERLLSDDFAERPWRSWSKGRPLAPKSLASLLRGYKVRSVDIGPKGGRVKGYTRRDLEPAWTRYAPMPTGGTVSPVAGGDDSSAQPRTSHEAPGDRGAGRHAEKQEEPLTAHGRAGVESSVRGSAGNCEPAEAAVGISSEQRPSSSLPGLWDQERTKEHPPKGCIDPETGHQADGFGGWLVP